MSPLHAIETFGIGAFFVLCCVGAGLGLCNLHTEALLWLGGGLVAMGAAVIAAFVDIMGRS